MDRGGVEEHKMPWHFGYTSQVISVRLYVAIFYTYKNDDNTGEEGCNCD